MKRYRRIQQRKDAEALKADSDDVARFKEDIASLESSIDQTEAYRMVLQAEQRRHENERRRREVKEAIQKVFEENLWKRFNEEFGSYIRASDVYRVFGESVTELFYDEYFDFFDRKKCNEHEGQEELEDLEVGETGCLDEFLSSFQ